jgi:hypothetical protein
MEMQKVPTWNLENISQKCSKYWRSVLLFGLPFTAIYRGIDYLIFRITTQNSPLVYPWFATVKMDILLIFLVSFIWWALMRQLVIWKRKYQAGGQYGSGPPDRRH